MKRLIKYTLLCIALCFTLFACNVHQWPDATPTVDVHISMTFNTKMDSLTLNRASDFASTNPDDYDIRHTLRAYYIKDNGRIAPDAVAEKIIINKVANGSFDVIDEVWALPPGRYRLYAWTDYVDNDSTEDKFYTTDDLSRVGITKGSSGAPTVGNCEFRDAFNGTTDVYIEPVYELDLPPVVAHFDMKRPLAKFEFITNDLDEFVSRVLEKRAEEAAASGTVLPDSALTPTAVDLNEYRIVIRYSGFMPDTFNLMDNDPIDATANVTFNSSVLRIDGNTASLGFDYVFVHTDKSNLKLSISVYNSNNTLLSAVSDITVPIERSKLTTIRGSFMTESAQGGVGIDPGWTDDIIYPVN